MAPQPFYRRFGPVILVVAASLIPFIVWGGYRAILSNSNDVRDWLPLKYPETREYRWFREQFGAQDFVVVSWPGCTLEDARLDRFAESLSAQRGSNGDDQLCGPIVTGRSLLRQLTMPPTELDRRRAIARLQGVLIGPDGQQTCALVFLRDSSARRLEPAISEIRQAAVSAGVLRDEVRLGGIPFVNATLNRESTNSLVRLASVSGLLGMLIAWLCFRDLRLTSLVLLVGIYSAALALAVVPMTGKPLNAVLITMVPLVYVTAVSGAIHLSNYYLDALGNGRFREAPDRAVRHAAVPLLLAAATTAIGLLSLGFSDLHPVQMFGVFSAIGVVIGSAAHFLLLPAALAVLMPPGFARRRRTKSGAMDPESHLGVFPSLGRWIVSHSGLVLQLSLIVLCLGALGLPRIRTSIQLMRLFSPTTPVIPMTRWLEEHLGATIPLEMVIRFSPESQTAILDRMRLVAATHAKVRRLPSTSGCLSAATFAPAEVNQARGENFLRRATLNVSLERRTDLLREHGWIAQDGRDELWRISLRIRGMDDLDYAAFVDTIRQAVAPVHRGQLSLDRPGVDLFITGTAPIVFKARQSLLNGMLIGLSTDIALIVVAVIAITRCWRTGAVMFLVGIFPTAVVFGSMGLLGIVVDIGSVMTPCVALGVTVDDVIHFMRCHRQAARQGASASHSALRAYGTCGRAIFQSWGIIGLGLGVFALSSFVPTFRFGLLMSLLLTAGMLGNLLFLPAILAGRIGQGIASTTRTAPQRSALPARLSRGRSVGRDSQRL
jgi:predicted RND superfamily exporter protein